jgi:hypothetical protein
VLTLRSIAGRIRFLRDQTAELDPELLALVKQHPAGPALIAEPGIGPVVAAQLLISWSHRSRVRNEAAFAALAGAAPVEASRGQRIRHRLNRGGDRDLNRALRTIAISRLRCHPESRDYSLVGCFGCGTGVCVLAPGDGVDADGALAGRVDGLPVELHAEFQHDAFGGVVAGLMDADDPVEFPVSERPAQYPFGRLRGQSLSPVRPAEAPADLDGGQDLGQEAGDRQAGEAGQFAGGADLHGEQSVPVFVPVPFEGGDVGGAALVVGDGAVADPPHHLGVGVDGGHRRDVVVAPAAQQKPWGIEGGHGSIVPTRRGSGWPIDAGSRWVRRAGVGRCEAGVVDGGGVAGGGEHVYVERVAEPPDVAAGAWASSRMRSSRRYLACRV